MANSTLLDPTARQEIAGRLRALKPDAKAQWGKFTAPRMVTHLIDSSRMALGEIKGLGTGKPILSWPGFKQLVLYVLPIPKAKAPTAPQLLATEPGDFEVDVNRVIGLIERFADPSTPTAPVHPAFGTMTKTSWGVLAYKHFDHHLRQFGR